MRSGGRIGWLILLGGALVHRSPSNADFAKSPGCLVVILSSEETEWFLCKPVGEI